MLYRIPRKHFKLSDSWEGPYVVLDRVGDVNYKIAREHNGKHAKVIHMNCLKKYVERGEVNRMMW